MAVKPAKCKVGIAYIIILKEKLHKIVIKYRQTLCHIYDAICTPV